MTLRLPQMQALAVEAIARSEGKSQSDVVREAIADFIESRKADPDFQKRLRARMDENNALLRRLATDA